MADIETKVDATEPTENEKTESLDFLKAELEKKGYTVKLAGG